MNRVGRVMLALCAGMILAGSIASRAQGQEFYKDKTIRFIVGYSAGGSFDLYTRTIARHFSKHVPSPYDTVCTFNDKSGIANVNDWFAAKRPMKISSIGPGTSTSDIPKLLKVALNLPLDVLEGYKGGADARLAVVSGEVDGYCGSWQTVETVWRSAYESGKIHAVLQASLESHPRYKQVPLAISYVKTDVARQLVTVADSAHGAQFPYTVPPGLAKERLELLQKAFVNTIKDSEFLAEANKSKLDIE